jgi:hypothetical protein
MRFGRFMEDCPWMFRAKRKRGTVGCPVEGIPYAAGRLVVKRAVEPSRNLGYVEPNLTATLEELDRAFVLLGRGAGPERSQVPQLSGLLVRPA